jgi:hypothetical protein
MEVMVMPFEEDLARRLKALPSKDVSDSAIEGVLHKLEHQSVESRRWKTSGGWGIAGAVLAAVILAAIVLNNLHLLPMGTLARRPQFDIVENPLAVTRTPLDTTGFRSALQDYLERHKLSTQSSTTSASLSNQSVTQHLPVINKISELTVRWSQLVDNKYAGATVTFVGNGKPRIANVLVLKAGRDTWNIEQVSYFPRTLSSSTLAQFPLYPGEWSGTGFTSFGNDQVQFEFVFGLVIDPAIRAIDIVQKGGKIVTLPIVNGAYGYFQVAPPGNTIYTGGYTVRGYNKWGICVFKQ